MSTSDNDTRRQEEISVLYTRIMISESGLLADETKSADKWAKIDIRVDAPIGYPEIVRFDIQVKSVRQHLVNERDGKVVYDLDADTYNHLVKQDGRSPLILVLVVLRGQPSDWVNITNEETVMRCTAYYKDLAGKKETENQCKRRIFIPKTNVFNPEGIRRFTRDNKDPIRGKK